MARKQHAEQHQPDFDRCCKFTWTECFEMGMHRHHPPMICISARQCPAASLYHTNQCYDQECTWVGHGFIGGGATMHRTWYTIINDVHHRTIVTSSIHGASPQDRHHHHLISYGIIGYPYERSRLSIHSTLMSLGYGSNYCIIQHIALFKMKQHTIMHQQQFLKRMTKLKIRCNQHWRLILCRLKM